MSLDNKKLEKEIKTVLNYKIDNLEVSDYSLEKIRKRVNCNIGKESYMKKFDIKKIVIILSAIFVIGGVTVIAGNSISYTVSSISDKDSIYNYNGISNLSKELGFDIKVPKKFSNGYIFDCITPVYTNNNENKDEKWVSVSVDYINNKDEIVFLDVSNNLNDFINSSKKDNIFNYNNIDIIYSNDKYMFVPEDYQISEEEAELKEKGELNISFGSDKVEYRNIQTAYFIKNNIQYIITDLDEKLQKDDIIEMVKEVIDNII